MRKLLIVAASGMLAMAGVPMAHAADMPTTYQEAPRPYHEAGPEGGVKIGYLDCTVGGGVGYVFGSAKTVDCDFHETVGHRYVGHYTGFIRKVGVDLGFTTKSRIVWAVFAPTAGYHHGSLGGLYQGLTAEATVGVGVGTNIMYGGTKGSIQLQPVSLQGQVGLNVAATGTSMTLKSVD